MKKLFLTPLILSAALMTATACSEYGPVTDGQEQATPGEDGRCLVLYCSRTGNTERMAQTMQSTLDCDMIEVVPETPYDDDYNSMLERAQAELADIGQYGNTHPGVAGKPWRKP